MSEFRRIYPGKGKLLFDGGLNTKYEKSIIEDNESPDCLNVVFNAGSVETRDGFTKVNTATVGTYVCDGLYARKGTGSAETMVAFFNGTGYALAGTSFITIGSAQSVMTAGQRVGAAQMENHIFFGNGAVIPYKYNGTDFTRHGVYPISNTASYVTGAAGSPNGAYSYKFVTRNSQSVAGNPSEQSTTITVASTKVEITSIPVSPQSHGIATRRIYRTVTSGTTFLLLTTLNDNTTTTYSDNTADASLGAAAPSDAGVPPVYLSIIYHQNRLFMIGTDNLVWYTDLNEPYTVAATNFLTIGDQSTDFPKALGVFNNALVIFGQRGPPWIVYMPDTTPTNWTVIKTKSAYTSNSPFGVFEYNNKLMFPAMQSDKFVGFAALTGDTLDTSSTMLTITTVGSDLRSDRIETDMFDVQEAYVGNISSTVFKNKAYISLTKASGSTTNNRVYVMDFSISNLNKNQKESWVPWTGLNPAQFVVYSGSLYYGTSTATGFVYKMTSGTYTDDGTAINSYYWTKEFSGGEREESFSKDFRYINLLVDLAGDYFMDLRIRTDSDSGDGSTYNIDLDPGGSLWGTMQWGRDAWGGGSTQEDTRVYLAGSRGKRVQFRFSNKNTVNQRFAVHWANFTYNLKGPR